MTDTDKSLVSYRSHLLAMTMRAPRVAVFAYSPYRRCFSCHPHLQGFRRFRSESGQLLDRAANIVFSLPDACSGT